MAFEFLAAARSVALQPTYKHVYLTLATYANEAGLCWPKVSTLVDDTGLNVRTVQRALSFLIEKELVKKKDRWMRSSLYWITPSAAAAKVTPAETTPYSPALATPIELQSELPSELPITGTQTKARVKQAAPIAKSSPIVLVDDIPKDLLADWQAVRASKNQKVLTATAMQALRDEAAKAGLSAAEAIRQCVISNWARFEARWLTPHPTETTAAPATPAAPVRAPEPEVVIEPISPEVLAARRESIEKLKRDIKAAAAEKPDPKARARAVIERKTAGEHVGRASLEFACFVLGIKSWKDAAQCAT